MYKVFAYLSNCPCFNQDKASVILIPSCNDSAGESEVRESLLRGLAICRILSSKYLYSGTKNKVKINEVI